MRCRPIGILLLASLTQVTLGSSSSSRAAGLADFGGDVSQYMSLLQGTSAFSFKPSGSMGDPEAVLGGVDEDEEARRRRKEIAAGDEGGMGDFGGDYGDYLKLLEGDSALGFNPQSDPIADNQDLQTDVFGGGMSGKFWDMYKGKSSYDDFDEADSEVVEQMSMERQTPEEDQPEDDQLENEEDEEENERRRRKIKHKKPKKKGGSKKEKQGTVIIAYKPGKAKLNSLYNSMKSALASKDKDKVSSIIDSLDISKLLKKKISRKRSLAGRKIMMVEDDDDEEEEDMEDESNMLSMKKELEQFVKKFNTNVPDPITTSKGLTMSYKNLTLYGLSDLKVCGKLHKTLGSKWKGNLCLPSLSATVDSVAGPGVPFKGKVSVIFRQPKIQVMFRPESDSSSLHILSVKTVPLKSKFVPTYDSSIPLNPWSKVSMSGYMVSRVKKILPTLVDKTILKLIHIVERLDKD